jgi:FHS family L-fucose permease-like MFS transporter
VAPYIGSALILGAAVEAPKLGSLTQAALQQFRAQQASTVRLPYLGIAGLLIVLAVALAVIKLPPMGGLTQDFRPDERGSSWGALLGHPQLLLGAVGIFVYVGAEVTIGSFLVNYMHLPEISGFTETVAAKYVSIYWFGAMIGRFVGSAVLQRVKTSSLLALAAAVACLLVLLSMFSSGHTAMWSILSVGLFNSIMFPSIFTLGIANLGELTSKGSSLMVCAIVGGAVIPLLSGFVADKIGVQHALMVAAACYVYIVAFGLRGDRSATEHRAA